MSARVPIAVSHRIPLAASADPALSRLTSLSGSAELSAIDADTLLCERAMLRGLVIPGQTSAGGHCHLFDAMGDTIALNLPRTTDLELLPALLESDELNPNDHSAIASYIALADATTLVARGRSMGIAIAAEHESVSCAEKNAADLPGTACMELVRGLHSAAMRRTVPLVVDLSSLWAGPLAGHLLWLAGARVVKVESRSRPDAMRDGDGTFYALLNQGKASVALDFADTIDQRVLLSLIAEADIVIEAARPRALAQLGIDAAKIVKTTPGLVWITITGHGAHGNEANWIGFGDDCGVSGGLSAALRSASGRAGFIGDAIADPLTGIFAALAAWENWKSRRGGRFGLAMSRVVQNCLLIAKAKDQASLTSSLRAWGDSAGSTFPSVRRRAIGTIPSFGEDTWSYSSKYGR